MSRTGEVCQTSGIYEPDCTHQADAIVISEGESLPPCVRCNDSVTWTRTYPARPETWRVFVRDSNSRLS